MITYPLKLEQQDWGMISYQDAYAKQRFLVSSMGEGAGVVAFCEHPPVITLGRMSHPKHVLGSEAMLSEMGVTVEKVDRGGDVTLHAPGQLMIYVMFDLKACGKDLHEFIRHLESICIDVLNKWQLPVERRRGLTGVWLGDLKIVSIGIGVRKWISFHGIGLNVNTDLNLFKYVNPCGLGVTMTSMAQQLNQTIMMDQVKEDFWRSFVKVYAS